MVKFYIKDNKIPTLDKNIACIGYFDGLHLGHQKLIKQTIKDAKKNNVKSALICFDIDTNCSCYNKHNKYILSKKEKINKIEEFGIDLLIVIKFDDDFMKLSSISFINNYLNEMNIVKLICGYDFRFGYKAKGDIDLLKNKGNFNLLVIDKLTYKNEKISSTRIKDCFINGQFKLTNRLLGYDYKLIIKVVNSTEIGSKWLIEAKSNDSKKIFPSDNKYNDNLYINDGILYFLSDNNYSKNELIEFDFKQYE